MTVLEDLTARNADFATHGFDAKLRINPSRRTMIICCVDPRVDPSAVLGVRNGEAAVIRNVGGRVTPATLKTMRMLGQVGKANGGGPGGDWNLVLLHHTDCGMTDLAAFPDLLAEYFEIPAAELPAKAVSDPYASVVVDAAVLRSPAAPSAGWLISGLVYDVGTGLVKVVTSDV